MAHSNTLRAAAEAKVILLTAQAKRLADEGKKRAARTVADLAEQATAAADYLAKTQPEAYRGGQMAQALLQAALNNVQHPFTPMVARCVKA